MRALSLKKFTEAHFRLFSANCIVSVCLEVHDFSVSYMIGHKIICHLILRPVL
jgi:hypothetical protein